MNAAWPRPWIQILFISILSDPISQNFLLCGVGVSKRGQIILEASDLGAKVIGFDLVFERGDETMAKPILDEINRVAKLNRKVVLAEALIPAASNGKGERIRSFPFREETSGGLRITSDRFRWSFSPLYVCLSFRHRRLSILPLRWPVTWLGAMSPGIKRCVLPGREMLQME